MKITILRNCKLIDGELYYDEEETYESDHIHFSLIRHYEKGSLQPEMIGFIIIGKAFSGKQIEIFKSDEVHIQEENKDILDTIVDEF